MKQNESMLNYIPESNNFEHYNNQFYFPTHLFFKMKAMDEVVLHYTITKILHSVNQLLHIVNKNRTKVQFTMHPPEA